MAAVDPYAELAGPEISRFHAWDYVVFALVLAISAGIGIYHAITGGKQKSQEEYLLASRSMSALPVALSVLASFFSASTLLGTPSEIYLEGTMYWISVFGAVCAPLVGAYVFGPFFYGMNVVSVFEYLENRYNSKAVRILGAALFLVRSILGMGIVLYGPSTALNAVTGFPVWAGIVVVGAVCCFYTTIGGLQAVIWTDVFQTVVMLMGMLAIIIKGAIEVGGIKRAWKLMEDTDRVEFFKFDPDPTVRHTFWTLIVGNFFGWIYPYTVDQQMIQRFSSTKNLKQARLSLLLNVPGMFIIISLCSLSGVIMFAYYADCDPLMRGTASNANQLLPRFVMDVLGSYPGLPGLFTASLFSGALSSVSSMLNSQSAVAWEDFCKLWFEGSQKVNEVRATTITKAISVVFAVSGIGVAFIFTKIGGTVLQMSLAFNGAAGAPLVGVFIMGCFLPWANWVGAFVGAVVGFVFTMWINIGAYITKPPVMNNYPRSIAGCPMANVSHLADNMTTMWTMTSDPTTDAPMTEAVTGLDKLYTLSYLWYVPVGILVTVLVGMLVSFMTGYTRPGDVDPKYMMSYTNTFWPCLPHKARKRCYCGVDFDKADDRDTEENQNVYKDALSNGKSGLDFEDELQMAFIQPADHKA